MSSTSRIAHAALVERERDLGGAPPEVDGHDDAAGPRDAEQRLVEDIGVERQDRHPIARLNAEFEEGAGQAGDPVARLGDGALPGSP